MALWGNRDSKTATGTLAIASNGAVTGSGTLFTTEAKIGNTIYADGFQYVITTITSNTVATVQSAVNGGSIPSTDGTVSYTLSEKPVYVSQSESSDTFGDSGDASKVFGVSATAGEMYAGGYAVTDVAIVQGGNGYTEPPSIGFDGEGGSATATAAYDYNGPVTSITVTNGGGYYDIPNVYIDVPRRTVIMAGVGTTEDQIYYEDHGVVAGTDLTYRANGGTAIGGLTDNFNYYAGQVAANTFKLYNTATRGINAVSDKTITMANVNTTAETITINSHGYVTGAEVNYNNQGGASITNLTSGNDYFVIVVNPNTIKLALTSNDATAGTAINLASTGNDAQTLASTGRINLTGTGNDNQYFDLSDVAGVLYVTATAVAVKGAGQDQNDSTTMGEYYVGEQHITHSGWVRKTVGTGGRAGRVQYETLVAGGSIIGDQADDIQFPDD